MLPENEKVTLHALPAQLNECVFSRCLKCI